MTEAQPIEILGQTYYLKGAPDPEYIKRVEQYLNEKIKEVSGAGGTVDTYNLMILVALNLADDSLRSQDRLRELQQEVAERSKLLINSIDSCLADGV